MFAPKMKQAYGIRVIRDTGQAVFGFGATVINPCSDFPKANH